MRYIKDPIVITQEILKIATLVILICGTTYLGYLHGYNKGLVDTESYLGPVLYKLVDLTGGKLCQLPKR